MKQTSDTMTRTMAVKNSSMRRQEYSETITQILDTYLIYPFSFSCRKRLSLPLQLHIPKSEHPLLLLLLLCYYYYIIIIIVVVVVVVIIIVIVIIIVVVVVVVVIVVVIIIIVVVVVVVVVVAVIVVVFQAKTHSQCLSLFLFCVHVSQSSSVDGKLTLSLFPSTLG